MLYKRLALIVSILAAFFTVSAQPYSGVRSLILRRAPWLSGHVILDSISGRDIFVLSMRDGKVQVSASSSSAAAKGVYYYLTHYCHRSMSHLGDNLSAPEALPVVEKPDTVSSPFAVRYALNYCTINYSMAFYGWAEWEHELDWMAFNGVNLMLVPVGMEAVWQKVLRQYGFSDREISAFLPGPAFTAWWLMGNLEGWGGAVPNAFIARQKKLERQILDRMRSLRIEPVLQGFYGMVPATLKEKHPEWTIIGQGKWAGGMRRPDILLPTDPHFAGVAKTYYSAVKEIYGDDIRFFGGEPFHEGGITTGIDVPAAAAAVQYAMLENVPNSTWVLQGWQNNPSDAMLERLDKKHVLIQELFGENTDNWYKRKGYNHTPFIWCTVTNFGGKQGLYGKLQRFADEVYRAQSGEMAGDMRGIGIMPEGIVNNPVVYDFVMDLAWKNGRTDAEKWVTEYVRYRYGRQSDELQQAWRVFVGTVYSSPPEYQEGPQESVFCARPSSDVRSVSTWGTRRRNYDTALFRRGVGLFIRSHAPAGNEPFATDRIDLVRQVLSNKGEAWYAAMMDAYKQKDSAGFNRASEMFLVGILQQDSLLSCSKYFQLNHWLTDAYNCMKDTPDRRLFLLNAKRQITFWGPDNNPGTDLHEYAHKEWNGMMRYFYYPRWLMFVRYCKEMLRGHQVELPDFYGFEVGWAGRADMYPAKRLSPAQLDRLIRRILSEK